MPAMAAQVDTTPLDALVETQPDGDSWLVLRYLAPSIAAGALGYEDVVEVLDRLCVEDGLPQSGQFEPPVSQIVVILLDRPVERGVPNPDATQYMGAYLPMGEVCEWE
jgi:hypothetical protein